MLSTQRLFQTVPRLMAMAAAGLSLSACAYVSQHPDGSASVVGLAAVSMHQTPGAPAGHVTVRSHGVTLSDRPPAQGLVVGVLDQQMQFSPSPPVEAKLIRSNGDYDFVGRTRMANGGYQHAEERHVVKRVKYRKKRKCRCR